MPYCSQCGVELDLKVLQCPLCSAPIQDLQHDPGSLPEYARLEYREERAQLPPEYRRRFAVYLLSLVFFTPLLIVVAVDYLYSGALDWSLFVVASLLTVWAYSVTPLLLLGRAATIVGSYVLVSGTFLWVLDRLHGEPWWFFSVGLPILGVLALVCLAVVSASMRVRSKGANIAAFVLMGVISLCMGIDLVVAMYLSSSPALGWSVIVAAALSPAAGFLLYLQYGIARRVDFRRKFHV